MLCARLLASIAASLFARSRGGGGDAGGNQAGDSLVNVQTHQARYTPLGGTRLCPREGGVSELARPLGHMYIGTAETAGRIAAIRARGPWVGEWLDELEAFPLGAHADAVDAAVGAFDALAHRKRVRVRRLT